MDMAQKPGGSPFILAMKQRTFFQSFSETAFKFLLYERGFLYFLVDPAKNELVSSAKHLESEGAHIWCCASMKDGGCSSQEASDERISKPNHHHHHHHYPNCVSTRCCTKNVHHHQSFSSSSSLSPSLRVPR